MKNYNKKTSATMAHYLIKFKDAVFLAILPLLAVCGAQAATALLMAQVFQRVFEGDLQGLMRWMLALAAAWFSIMAVNVLYEALRARAIRKMNNALRADMAATFISMGHGEYHSAATGEYLSQFTNNVNQIETLAWLPFFQLVEFVATAVFCIAAMLTIHWSLLLAALLTTLVMVFVPQLFNRLMERLGDACAKEQAGATVVFKDLLSGWDVLRSFGRGTRFTKGIGAASEQIERPRFRLAYVKSIVGSVNNCVNVICQCMITGLVGLLAIWGYTQPGSLAAGGNLCGSLSNCLGGIAGLLLSFSSAKPYFEKITLPSEEDTAPKQALSPGIGAGIAVEGLSFGYEGKPGLENTRLREAHAAEAAAGLAAGLQRSDPLRWQRR